MLSSGKLERNPDLSGMTDESNPRFIPRHICCLYGVPTGRDELWHFISLYYQK
jgi:hypothetical protein